MASKCVQVLDNGYSVLVVSQFTLFATFKGLKPNFNRALNGLEAGRMAVSSAASEAEPIYDAFVASLRQQLGPRLATGAFGAMMPLGVGCVGRGS